MYVYASIHQYAMLYMNMAPPYHVMLVYAYMRIPFMCNVYALYVCACYARHAVCDVCPYMPCDACHTMRVSVPCLCLCLYLLLLLGWGKACV